jgi:preprotein translocase subunit SecD
MPTVPKPAAQRQRRNRTSTNAVLPTEASSKRRKVPPLPAREKLAEVWHPRVVEWWAEVWTSPMAAEYLGADMKGGLYLLAELHQRRWTEADTGALVRVAAEIRQQEIRFGLSPIDRRRLQWEVEKAEQAEEQTTKRRQRRTLSEVAKKDPRDVLKVV